LSALERIRTNTQPRFWSALYQQRPAPEEGDFFKREWLKPYSEVPARETLQVYGGSDYAVTADGGDYCVHLVVGLDPNGRMYLLDIWRKQAASDEWVEAFCDLVLKWKPLGWAEEVGQIRSGIGPYLDRRQRERCAYVYRQAFPTRSDKAIRCQSIRGRMALEGLYVPVNAPWYPDFLAELLSFPAGKHDDICDSLGLVGQTLDVMVKGNKPVPPEKPEGDISGYRPYRMDVQPGDWLTY
jgi:predicted phage terminase large subunit-like protein